MAERFEPQMGRQPWLNELGKQDRRGVFPQFILDVDKASFTHRPMLHSKELHDHLHGTLDPMEFLKLRQSASAAEAHRTAKKAMRSGLSSIYSSKKAAPVSPSPMQTSTSKASRPGSAPSSTRSRAFSAAATWDVWTSTRQIGVVRFRKNPAQLTLHDLRTVVARQVPELPRDFQFMYEDGVLIHRAQERTLRTKRQHKTKKVFVHFLEDFDDQDKKKSAGFTDRKLPIKIKTSMRPTLILDSPAQPIKTTSKPIAPSVAASPSSAFVAAAPVEATTKKCPFKDTPELKNVTARPDMQPPRIESSTQTAIDSIPFTPQEVHDQTNTSPTSWSMVTAIRKQIAHHEELAAKTIQILVRHVLKVRRQARERDRMRIADAEAAAAREQSRIELERAQKVAADSAALKAEQEARESAITLKEEAERAERARLEAEAAAERARQAAVTMDVTSAHGIDGAKVAALLLQQFQYQEAIKTNAATALIQNLARKRIAKRPKKPPSPTEEERMAHIDELAAEEMACAKRDAQQANEALALANQTKASIAREAEVAAEKVARTEAIAARARARFTRVKSRLKAMRVLGKVSNSARGFPQSTVPSLEKPFEPTKAAAEVVDNTAQGIFSDFTLEKATRTNSAGMVSVKSSLETAARPVKSEASKFPSLEPDSLYDASSYSEKVTFWVENMQLPTEARLRTQGVPESPIQDSVDIADSSRCERLEQKALNAISDIQELTTSDSNTAGSNIATKQIIEMQRKRSSLASKTSRAETSIEAGKTTEKSASKTLKSTVPGLASSIQATDAHHTASSLQIDPPASALFFEEDWNFLEKPLAEAEAAQAQVRLADAERNVNNLLLMEVAAKARVRAIAAKSAVEKQKIASEAVARRKAREREAETCAAQTLEVQKLKSALAKGGLEHQQYLKYLKDVAAYEAHYKKVIEEGAHQRALLENCTLHGELCLHARHSKSWWLALRSLSTVQILCADGLEDWERRRGLYESPKPSIDTPDSKQSSLHCCEVPEERDHTNTTSTSISLPGDPEDVLNSDMERSSMEEECQFPALTSEPTECEDSLVSDGGSTGTSVSITSLPQASAPDLGIEDDAAAAAASSLRRLNTAIDSSCVISEAYRSSPQKRLSPPLPELPLDQWSATGRATVTTPPLTWDCSSALFQADISCNSESNALLGARPTLKLSPASFEPSPHTPLPVDNRLDGCRTPDESQVFSILDVGQSCSDPDFGNYAWMAPAEILLSPRPRLSAASDRETLEELKMPTLNLSDTFPLAFRNDGDGKADSFSSPLHTPTAILGNPATPSGTDHSGMSETALFPLDAPLMSVQTATASLGQPATLSARENKDLPESAYLPLDTPAAPTHPSPLVAMAASIREGSCFNDLNSAERDICDVVRPRTVVPDIKPEVTAAFEPFSTPALEVALSPQLRDFMDAPILGLEHASVEAENNLMGCLSATRLVPSFRINDDQAVPLTEAVNDFLTHSLEALPSALLATNNALDELLGGNVHIDNQFGDEALKDDIDQAEVDEVVPHSCSSMDENFATSTAKLAAKNATIVTAAISRVIARQGVRFDDGRRLAAWLEQSSTGSGVRTAHAYDPLGSETFAATVTPSIWAAAVTEALNHFNSASSVTAGSEGPSIKGSRSEAAGDASDESDATAAHVLLGWLSVSASKGLAIDVPEKTISQLNEPLSPQLRTMEHIEKVSCQPLFEKKMKRSGDDRDAPFHRCVTKLIDGRRFMVWLQYGNDASFQDHDCTVHAFDPLSAQTYTCAVTPETWKAAQEIIMHYAKGYERNDKSTSNNSENLKDGQDESAIQVMPSTSVTENIASEAEDIIFDWLRLNHTQGLHFRELQNSIREAECCRGNTLNVIDTSEPKKERMMTQNSNIHRMTSLRNIRSLSPNRVLSTTEPVIMLASADGRKNSLRNLESLSPSHATSAMEPKDEVISTNFLEPGSNLTPRSGSNDEGSQDTNASRRTLFDYSDDLKISPENESLDSYSLDDNDSQEVLTARSTSSTGYFGEDDENVMIDIFRHPWRALQYNLPALTKGQFVDGQLLLLAVTLRLPSLVFHITATPVAGSESFSIEAERATWAHVLPRLPPLPLEAEYNTGKHYQRIASELVRCLAFSSSRKLRNDYDGYYDPDVDTEHNATHTAEISAGNTQLVLKLHGLSSDFSDEDENADESTMVASEIGDLNGAASPLYTAGVHVGDQFLVTAAHNDRTDRQLVLEVYNDDTASTHMLAICPDDWGLNWRGASLIDRRAFAKRMLSCLLINDQGLPTLPALVASRSSSLGSSISAAPSHQEGTVLERVVLPQVCNLRQSAVPLISVKVQYQSNFADYSSNVPPSTLVVSACDSGADGCFVCALESTTKKHYHGQAVIPGWDTFTMASKTEWAHRICQKVSFSDDSLINTALDYSSDNDYADQRIDCSESNGDWIGDMLEVTVLRLVNPEPNHEEVHHGDDQWHSQKLRYTNGRMISGAWHICKIFTVPGRATVGSIRHDIGGGSGDDCAVLVEAFNPLTVEAFTFRASPQELSRWCGDEAAACIVDDGNKKESAVSSQQEQLFEALLDRLRIKREGNLSLK